MKVDIKLTAAQIRTLKALQQLTKTNPRPSLQEWADVAGTDGRPLTLAAIMPHRAVLMAYGLIANEPGKTRSTHVTADGAAFLRENS